MELHPRPSTQDFPVPTAWQQHLAEAVGTFFLVFAGTGSIVINDVTHGTVTHVGIALTFGLVVLALIYAIGDVSGCHLNPAVSLGFCFAGRFPVRSLPGYLFSQLIGAGLASLTLQLLFPSHATLGATIPTGSGLQSFVMELLLTLMLMFVILNVSHGAKETGILAGVAVGAVIALEALFAGPISGASMNPARSLAPAIMSGRMEYLWVYCSAPIAGALSAVILYQMIRGRDAHNTQTTDGR